MLPGLYTLERDTTFLVGPSLLLGSIALVRCLSQLANHLLIFFFHKHLCPLLDMEICPLIGSYFNPNSEIPEVLFCFFFFLFLLVLNLQIFLYFSAGLKSPLPTQISQKTLFSIHLIPSNYIS